ERRAQAARRDRAAAALRLLAGGLDAGAAARDQPRGPGAVAQAHRRGEDSAGIREIPVATVPNHALRQLRAGKLAIGLGVNLARTVNIGQLGKTCGFDWLFIDGEHSSLDLDTAAQISSAALGVGITPVVRVAGLEHWHASRILDNGAQGIVYPHIDTQEQAVRAANACRYPPIGKRSMGGALQQVGFASMPVGEVAR